MKNLVALLADREYRRAYVEAFLNTSIAAQIKANREARGLSQDQLADLTGMKQPTISRLENVSYESWSVKTLKRLAEAFDVALVIRFERFSTAIHHINTFSREALVQPSFAEDSGFKEEAASTPIAKQINPAGHYSWALVRTAVTESGRTERGSTPTAKGLTHREVLRRDLMLTTAAIPPVRRIVRETHA